MSTNYNCLLLVPPLLKVHNSQVAKKWKRFKWAWTSYAQATELHGKTEQVQVATLLIVISEEA